MVMIPLAQEAEQVEPAEPALSVFPPEDMERLASVELPPEFLGEHVEVVEVPVSVEVVAEPLVAETHVPEEILTSNDATAAITKEAGAVAPAEAAANLDGQITKPTPPTREQLLERAKERLIEIALEQDELTEQIDGAKERLKELKDEHAGAASELRRLLSGEPVQMDLPVCTACGRATEPAHGETCQPAGMEGVASPSPVASDTPPADAPASNAWRVASITVINLDGIVGLGDKKKDKLIAEVPTVGDMEDLRVRAAACMPPEALHKHLPKGIGQQSADVIEERLLNWLTKHQSAEPEAQAVEAVGEPADEATDEAAPDAEDVGDEGREALGHGEADDAERITQRHAELSALGPLDRPEIQFGEIYADGKRAAQNNWPITDCGWTDPDKIDSWLIGHITETRDMDDGEHTQSVDVESESEAEPAEATA